MLRIITCVLNVTAASAAATLAACVTEMQITRIG